MQSVWLVERGDGENYGVIGVYTSQEQAERIKNIFNAGNTDYGAADILELKLNEPNENGAKLMAEKG